MSLIMFYGMLQNGCLLFSAIGSPTPFPHSVSGPRSCECGGPGACTSDEDNLVDTALGVEAEEECREMCAGQDRCSVYTWYNASAVLANACFMMRFIINIPNSEFQYLTLI